MEPVGRGTPPSRERARTKQHTHGSGWARDSAIKGGDPDTAADLWKRLGAGPRNQGGDFGTAAHLWNRFGLKFRKQKK